MNKVSNIKYIAKNDSIYPTQLLYKTFITISSRLSLIGNSDILHQKPLAVFCSVKCPGNLILQTYDLAKVLRDSGKTVISGFHTPMEKECLSLLLKGTQPIVTCPARGLERMRIPAQWKEAIEHNRLLILSCFDGKIRRATKELAEQRNYFVASLADEILFIHASRGGSTHTLARNLISLDKKVLVLSDKDNTHLIDEGAVPVSLEYFRK